MLIRFKPLCLLFLAVLAVCVFTTTPPALSQIQNQDIIALYEARQREIAELMEGATVFIVVKDDQGDSISIGSGFVVADGYILTNEHVISEGAAFYVLNTRLKATTATVVKKQANKKTGIADFALLRLDKYTQLPVLTFNTQISRMDRVSAWGFPHLITQFDEALEKALSGNLNRVPPVVYTEGTVNAIVRDGQAVSIIHSAAIAAGNSGGPLINNRGEVVGINTWGAKDEDEGAFVNGAIPADKIVHFLQKSGITPLMSRRTAMGIPATPIQSEPDSQPAPVVPGAPGVPVAPGAPDSPATAVEEAEHMPTHIALLNRAKAGDAAAQYQLGYNLFYGEGVDEDEKEALFWLTKSAQQGHGEGTGTLGMLYILSTRYKDIHKGLQYLEAAVSKEEYFTAFLAILYYEGEIYGVPRDVDKSFQYATRGAALGYPHSQALLGMLYYYGDGPKMDKQKAYNLAKQAIAADSKLGLSLMAWMYYTGNIVEEDSKKAFVMAQDAAEAEEGSAMGLLALLYYTGDGVDEDDEKALFWAQRASDAGNEFGHFVLGSLYIDGYVVKTNLPQAWAYLTLAQKANVAKASELLEKLTAQMSQAQQRTGRNKYNAWRKKRGLPTD